MRSIYLFVLLSRPIFLLGAVMIYALGAGIARYSGLYIDWTAYVYGQLWALSLQLSVHYFNEYFDTDGDQDNPNRTWFSGGSGSIGEGKLDRRTPLFAGLASLAFLTSFTILIIVQIQPSVVVYLIMLLSFLGAFWYSVPPIRLESTGYGELTTSILVGFLLPAFAYSLQAGEIDRLVPMTTFPLTIIHLAMMIGFEYPDYYADLKHKKLTLLTRMGWLTGMNFHIFLILCAYSLLFIMYWMGLPGLVVLHGFFSFPLGLFQIWQILRIRSGASPNWNLFTLAGLATFGTMCYFIAFFYWTG